ncbi:glycoside hydrolase family 19 protein [Halomonas venusta]|uniref:glycoside hydrolase family 19 protein n=1 Tax=Vreelandella venusta TaxID=44935 RepID=UPI00295EC396|nr:glycoside hydrolase family 19 protein [Halomonas venusta]MDW0357815.1 glycoside hydrolase family 19 protein [Halomonas venusta]
MKLNHDNSGFLVGERLSAEDITGRLDAIRDELRALRSDLSQGRPSSGVKPPPSRVSESASSIESTVRPHRAAPPKAEATAQEVVITIDRPASPATPPDRRESGRYVYKSAEREESTLKEKASGSTQAPTTEATVRESTATPIRTRDASGRFSTPDVATPTGSTLRGDLSQGRPSSGRGADGRFMPIDKQGAADGDEGNLISRSIDGMSSKLGSAVQAIGSGTDEADPAIKAFNEVAQPMSRGFGKIMGDSSDRKQERWYRRFWMMMRGSRREDRAEGKQQQRILKNIERKPAGGNGGSMLWRLLAVLLVPLGTLVSLAMSLPLAIAGAFVAGLKGLLTAIGLGGAAVRIPVPGRNRDGRSRTAFQGQPSTRASRQQSQAGGGANPGGSSRSGGISGALKQGARRLPGVGALLGLGFMANDIASSERGDATREEKNVTTGRAIGGGLGGIGGIAGGAAAGAAIGSVVPVIGTAVGGIVGAIAGGYFGGNAGEDIGEKVGGWVTDLRKSNLVSSLSQRWEYATTFMSSLWSQASESMAERWEYASTFASSMWSQASEGVAARWDTVAKTAQGLWDSSTAKFNSTWESLSSSMSARWTSITDEMKGVWSGAVTIAAEGWSTLTDALGGANDWIAEKTGVDIGQATRDAGEWVSDRAAKSTEWVGGRAEAAADRIENATNWIGGRISEGASWVGEKTGVTSAVNAVRNAHNEASAVPALSQAMAEAGITDHNEQAAFMGQMHHESGGFRTMEESFNYRSADRIMAVSRTARNQGQEAVEAAMAQGPEAVAELMYGGRMGNTEPGDGHRYRGRGFTQLTGRDNYTAASEALGIDLVNNPDMAADPEVAAKVATWYWQNRGGLSEASKRGDTREVTRLINGGHNGLEDREAQTGRYLAAAQAGEFTLDAQRAPEPVTASASQADFPRSTTVRTNHLSAMGLSMARAPTLGAAPPHPLSIPAISVPPVNEAPTVSAPIASSSGRRSSEQLPPHVSQDVSRDVGDRRIAHIVTGAYSGMS